MRIAAGSACSRDAGKKDRFTLGLLVSHSTASTIWPRHARCNTARVLTYYSYTFFLHAVCMRHLYSHKCSIQAVHTKHACKHACRKKHSKHTSHMLRHAFNSHRQHAVKLRNNIHGKFCPQSPPIQLRGQARAQTCRKDVAAGDELKRFEARTAATQQSTQQCRRTRVL